MVSYREFEFLLLRDEREGAFPLESDDSPHDQLTVSKLKVYDKKNCTMVFNININSNMYGEMILGVFEIVWRGNFKEIQA